MGEKYEFEQEGREGFVDALTCAILDDGFGMRRGVKLVTETTEGLWVELRGGRAFRLAITEAAT